MNNNRFYMSQISIPVGHQRHRFLGSSGAYCGHDIGSREVLCLSLSQCFYSCLLSTGLLNILFCFLLSIIDHSRSGSILHTTILRTGLIGMLQTRVRGDIKGRDVSSEGNF